MIESFLFQSQEHVEIWCKLTIFSLLLVAAFLMISGRLFDFVDKVDGTSAREDRRP